MPINYRTDAGVAFITLDEPAKRNALSPEMIGEVSDHMAAAVADWRVTSASDRKIKKDGSGRPPALEMAENPDILAWISRAEARPALVVGFAAETDDLLAHARAKLQRKGADWIVANDVRAGTGIMGGTENAVTLLTAERAEAWPRMSKDATAERLADQIAAALR